MNTALVSSTKFNTKVLAFAWSQISWMDALSKFGQELLSFSVGILNAGTKNVGGMPVDTNLGSLVFWLERIGISLKDL